MFYNGVLSDCWIKNALVDDILPVYAREHILLKGKYAPVAIAGGDSGGLVVEEGPRGSLVRAVGMVFASGTVVADPNKREGFTDFTFFTPASKIIEWIKVDVGVTVEFGVRE
ncbi:hypothetical protein EX30DRAFT_372552 [Ascodesmis nigricans]|uniref:Uncharacterized protein n=1 Tax=Ascodesmis nigricans TaxID=341454 RepID=A0A4S2MU73_9PEZI|nr:hypothetical protein EX30DRAFT_372552 [Ascodesmis nigricans]